MNVYFLGHGAVFLHAVARSRYMSVTSLNLTYTVGWSEKTFSLVLIS